MAGTKQCPEDSDNGSFNIKSFEVDFVDILQCTLYQFISDGNQISGA